MAALKNELLQFLCWLTIMVPVCGKQPTCHPKDVCSCEMSDGTGTVDLHPISSASNPPRFKNIPDDVPTRLFKYSFDPCKRFTMGACNNVLLCQVYEGTPKLYYDVGSVMSTTYDSAKKQLTFVYSSSHTSSTKKTAFVALQCDEKADTPVLSKFKESPADSYHSTLTSKYACFKKASSKKKISVGTILCIIALVLLVLYISLGIVLNKYYRQKEGSELFPNVTFWKDFPSLVKDGCLFSWTKVRGKSSEYQQI